MSKKRTILPKDSISMLIPQESHATLIPDDSISNIAPQQNQNHHGYHQEYQDYQNYQNYGYNEPYNEQYNEQYNAIQVEEPQYHVGQSNRLSVADLNNPFMEENNNRTSRSSRSSKNSRSRTPRSSTPPERPRNRSNRNTREPEVSSPKRYMPFFTYFVTGIHFVTLIIGLVMNKQINGDLLAPVAENIMLGPDTFVLIKQGARFVPCMKRDDFNGPQFKNATVNKFTGDITSDQLCGFSSGNQWYRIIIPVFLHAGIIHLLLNAFFQLTLLKDLEKIWGFFRIIPIFIVSGAFSFLFGATYGNSLVPSVGSSGALFGIMAALIINLLVHWKSLHKPFWQLLNLIFAVVISVVIGLFVKSIDNHAHIGGLIMGIGNSLIFAPYESVAKTLKRVGVKKSLIYSLWFPWLCRLIGLVWSIVLFVVVWDDFYSNKRSCTICQL